MKALMMPIGWLSWRAADLTAWIFEQTPDWELERVTYSLYRRTCLFAFWLDERFDLGQTEKDPQP